jgi:hypothetical protein
MGWTAMIGNGFFLNIVVEEVGKFPSPDFIRSVSLEVIVIGEIPNHAFLAFFSRDAGLETIKKFDAVQAGEV